MCGSRTYPYFPHRRDWNFLGVGRGAFQRPEDLNKCMKLNCNLRKGGEVLENSLPWGRYGYFMELHNFILKELAMCMQARHLHRATVFCY